MTKIYHIEIIEIIDTFNLHEYIHDHGNAGDTPQHHGRVHGPQPFAQPSTHGTRGGGAKGPRALQLHTVA